MSDTTTQTEEGQEEGSEQGYELYYVVNIYDNHGTINITQTGKPEIVPPPPPPGT